MIEAIIAAIIVLLLVGGFWWTRGGGGIPGGIDDLPREEHRRFTELGDPMPPAGGDPTDDRPASER